MPGRVGLTDSVMDVYAKLSQGNPGALSVLLAWTRDGPAIDPDAGLSPVLQMLVLDDLDIVGPGIWVLYKDTCGEDLATFLAVLRAYQLGLLDRLYLQCLADRRRAAAGVEIASLVARVREQLPRFGQQQKKEA